MKDAFALIVAIAKLWVCLFALGTFLLVLFAPLLVPAILFARWL